jgi:hypothetical protein
MTVEVRNPSPSWDSVSNLDPDNGFETDPPELRLPLAMQDVDYLASLFKRVNNLLGASCQSQNPDTWYPVEPTSFDEIGLTQEEVERLILKFLSAKGSASGRRISQQVCLPFAIVEPLLRDLKQKQLLVFKGATTPVQDSSA